jgi:ribosome modulation factor
MRLLTPFIERRREGRRYSGGETVNRVIQCFHFREKRGRGSAHFGRRKKHARRLLIPTQKGNQRMKWLGGVRWWAADRVGRCLD